MKKRLVVRFVALLVAAPSLFGVANEARSQVSMSERGSRVDVSATSSRPIADAVLAFGAQRGIRMTYEDPPYLYAGDLADVAAEVRRDSNTQPVRIPMGGTISMSFDKQPSSVGDARVFVPKLLAAQAQLTSGGRFAWQEDVDGTFHVYPAETRGPDGAWRRLGSVLETSVSIDPAEVTGMTLLKAICEQVSKTSPYPVRLGSVPLNAFAQKQTLKDAKAVVARSALLAVVLGTGSSFTWALYFDPDDRAYYLNVIPYSTDRATSRSPDSPGSPSQNDPFRSR